MTDTVAELARRGRALAPENRVWLVDLLLESFEESADPAVGEAWRQEIRRRIAAYECGEAELFDADEVMAEAKRLTP
jgi:putative addiction module component (TIGR02574 family)